MTSVSSMNSAAVLILQQPNSSDAAATGRNPVSVPDAMLATATGVSGEPSAAKIQASSSISNGLWDGKEKRDGVVQAALDYLDSDLFQSSDPRVKDTLKKLIGENGEEFARQVQAEQSKNAGITLENAIVNAIGATIRDNRGQFSAGEFVVGFKFSGGGSMIENIADINGNSTYQSMMDDFHTAHAALLSARQSGETGLWSDAGTRPAEAAFSAWTDEWLTRFGFDLPE